MSDKKFDNLELVIKSHLNPFSISRMHIMTLLSFLIAFVVSLMQKTEQEARFAGKKDFQALA